MTKSREKKPKNKPSEKRPAAKSQKQPTKRKKETWVVTRVPKFEIGHDPSFFDLV